MGIPNKGEHQSFGIKTMNIETYHEPSPEDGELSGCCVYRYTFAEFVEFLDRCGMEIRIKEVARSEIDLL